MNVLALTSSYPRYEGDPTAPFIESITKHIAALGHTVHLVVPESAEWRRPRSEGSVTYHPYRYSPRRSWTPWGYSESLQDGVKIKRALFVLAPFVAVSALHTANRLLASERFDVVHAHWVIPNGPIAARAARRHAVPLVVSMHGSDMGVAERSAVIGRAASWSFSRSAAVTAPSRDLLQRARKLGAACRLELVPYGADVHSMQAAPGGAQALRERLGLAPQHIVVAGIGRLVRVKGFEYLIDAHAEAVANEPRLRLLLVGEGDLRDELAARVQALGVGETVVFAGKAARSEIPDYLSAADIVAVPSVHYEGYVDGLPNVALEAMAGGRPLVATDVGGLPDLVRTGVNGVLVAEGDSHELAQALLKLAADPPLRARLGQEGQREIRDERSWDTVAVRYVDLYTAVTSGR
jgi:glycosyltransferase involved in cell wall biosynthesis